MMMEPERAEDGGSVPPMEDVDLGDPQQRALSNRVDVLADQVSTLATLIHSLVGSGAIQGQGQPQDGAKSRGRLQGALEPDQSASFGGAAFDDGDSTVSSVAERPRPASGVDYRATLRIGIEKATKEYGIEALSKRVVETPSYADMVGLCKGEDGEQAALEILKAIAGVFRELARKSGDAYSAFLANTGFVASAFLGVDQAMAYAHEHMDKRCEKGLQQVQFPSEKLVIPGPTSSEQRQLECLRAALDQRKVEDSGNRDERTVEEALRVLRNEADRLTNERLFAANAGVNQIVLSDVAMVGVAVSIVMRVASVLFRNAILEAGGVRRSDFDGFEQRQGQSIDGAYGFVLSRRGTSHVPRIEFAGVRMDPISMAFGIDYLPVIEVVEMVHFGRAALATMDDRVSAVTILEAQSLAHLNAPQLRQSLLDVIRYVKGCVQRPLVAERVLAKIFLVFADIMRRKDFDRARWSNVQEVFALQFEALEVLAIDPNFAIHYLDEDQLQPFSETAVLEACAPGSPLAFKLDHGSKPRVHGWSPTTCFPTLSKLMDGNASPKRGAAAEAAESGSSKQTGSQQERKAAQDEKPKSRSKGGKGSGKKSSEGDSNLSSFASVVKRGSESVNMRHEDIVKAVGLDQHRVKGLRLDEVTDDQLVAWDEALGDEMQRRGARLKQVALNRSDGAVCMVRVDPGKPKIQKSTLLTALASLMADAIAWKNEQAKQRNEQLRRQQQRQFHQGQQFQQPPQRQYYQPQGRGQQGGRGGFQQARQGRPSVPSVQQPSSGAGAVNSVNLAQQQQQDAMMTTLNEIVARISALEVAGGHGAGGSDSEQEYGHPSVNFARAQAGASASPFQRALEDEDFGSRIPGTSREGGTVMVASSFPSGSVSAGSSGDSESVDSLSPSDQSCPSSESHSSGSSDGESSAWILKKRDNRRKKRKSERRDRQKRRSAAHRGSSPRDFR